MADLKTLSLFQNRFFFPKLEQQKIMTVTNDVHDDECNQKNKRTDLMKSTIKLTFKKRKKTTERIFFFVKRRRPTV